MSESNQFKWVGIRPTDPPSDPIPVASRLTTYEEESGTGADDYTDDNTYEFDADWVVWDILIETFAAFISFKNADGEWGDDKPLPVGMYSIDFYSDGLRIRNRVAGSNTVYSFTRYR